MKKVLVSGIFMFLLISCEQMNVTSLTVDGAVFYQEGNEKLNGAYGVFIVAKAQVDAYDRNALPEVEPPLSDTVSSFPQIEMPSFLTPEKNAIVKVNNETLEEAYSGQYQGKLREISPLDTINIYVMTQEGDTGKAMLLMPGNFSLYVHDTAFMYDSISSIDLAWAPSKNACAYLVLAYKVDTAGGSPSLVLKNTTRDTVFSISKDELERGQYVIQIASVYGRLNASMPQAGTLVGVLGQVAALYIKKPIIITLN